MENVIKCFISARSQVTYNHKLVMLMVWLFDCWQKHLEKSTVMRMKNMEKPNKEQTKATKEKKKGEEKEKNIAKEEEKKRDDCNHLRMLCYKLHAQVQQQQKGKTS